ncbi:Transcriptional regulatory protein SrrA [compost metagenome]
MRNLLRIYFRKEGYQVTEAASGREGLERLGQADYDLVLLDVMMPELDGWQVCAEIRVLTATPILMLTARTDTRDKVNGLKLGADDYVTKPFEPEELLARAEALIRRYRQQPVPQIEIGGLAVYPEAREIRIHGALVDFTPKEFDMLALLAKNPGRAYSRDSLVELLWGYDFPGETRVVDTHIKNIREKTQKAGLSYNPIQTVWGVGYKFNLPEPGGSHEKH